MQKTLYKKDLHEPKYQFLNKEREDAGIKHLSNPKAFMEYMIYFRFIIKISLTDQLKILIDKIKGNKAQYNLDREAAKAFALSYKELRKYKYLSGEDLGYKTGVVEQAKLEYSLLGKIFNKGLER